MMNQIMLGAFAVITLLIPANVQSILEDETNTDQANVVDYVRNLLLVMPDHLEDEKEKEVTLQTSNEAEAAPTPTPEEKQEHALEEWKENFPLPEGDTDQEKFVRAIAPAAVLIANEQGIYPSVMIAQAGLESSWGRSDLAQSYNNLMGTKGSWNGETVTARTREDINGESVYIDAGFSVYDSWTDSLHRYGQLMKNGLNWDSEYYQGTWRENTDNYKDATAWLQGRYATDTAYATKLNQTIESFNLDQYDDIDAPDENLEELLAKMDIENENNL